MFGRLENLPHGKVAPHAGSVDRNLYAEPCGQGAHVAPHAGSVDRNNQEPAVVAEGNGSLPTRGAWIEIFREPPPASVRNVAPHAGSVDRTLHGRGRAVAGGVVAPHAGSVDRNPCRCGPHKTCERSLPTRGAWIEIRKSHDTILRLLSLPTRGAWREIHLNSSTRKGEHQSLPTRGAWIEIKLSFWQFCLSSVAPHAGSVDRNYPG